MTLIWMFAGLMFPLYQEDRWRAQSLRACLDATSGDDRAVQDCYDQDRTRVLARDAINAFEATYGEAREWPISIFLLCILPPMLCYSLMRFLLFAISATLPRPQSIRKRTDPVQFGDPTPGGDGANGVTLEQARRNYTQFGASEPEALRYVRLPRPHEFPES